jgi:hypothetical protein
VRTRPLVSLTVLAALVVFNDACANEQKSDPAPIPSAVPSVASAPSAPAASVAVPVALSFTPALFCLRVFGSIGTDFAKACTDDDKKSPEYELASALSRAPLDECNAAIRDSVAAGRLTFDAAAAMTCADAADKKKKGTTGIHLYAPDLDELPECRAVVTAKQTADQSCRASLECVAPLTCIGAHEKVDGSCKPLPTKAGEACDGVVWELHDLGHRPHCGSGLACDLPEANYKIPTCRAAVAKGGACVDSDECAERLACHAGLCDDGPTAAVGGRCTDDNDDCALGLYCARAKGAASGTCAAKKPAGAACTDVFECRGECKKRDAGASVCAAICGSG